MSNLGASWRTTLSGLVVIGLGVMLYMRAGTDQAAITAAGALVVAGIGLVKAKDA